MQVAWIGWVSYPLWGGSTQTQAAGFWFAARHRVEADVIGISPETIPVLGTDKNVTRQLLDWTAPLPSVDMVGDPQEHAAMVKHWHAQWGDRRQEIAIIGLDLDEHVASSALDSCLLTDTEIAAGPSSWIHIADPFPEWGR